MRYQRKTFSVHAVALVLSVAATGWVHHQIDLERPELDHEASIPDPRVARVASIGFQSVVADRYWLQAVQVVGRSIRDPSRHGALLGDLIDVVVTLDPWVDHPYRFAALWMTDSLESVRKADSMLQRSFAYHPREWRNPFYQGVNRLLYLDDEAGAADSLARAIEIPGSPRYLPRLVARLRSGQGGLDAAATMLQELIASTEDPYARAEYEKGLDAIETERRARVLDAAREEFRRRHGRDIARVEELVQGPEPVLAQLPPELHGWEWVIHPETDRIVSSWYMGRYEPFVHPAVQHEREEKREQERRAAEEGERS